MDIATLVGLVFGIAVVLVSILMGAELTAFIDPPSIMIVGGGTLSVTLMRFPLKTVFGSFKIAMKAFKTKIAEPTALIKRTVELAAVVRREGLLALENEKVDDEFLGKGLRLCIDGVEPEFVRKVLESELDQTVGRHQSGQKVFKAIGDAAPAMGMVGTLIGLVILLRNMDDPKSIGPAMAVAILTTLYGSLIANMFAIPVAEKLELRSGQEVLNKTLVIEAVSAIQEGRNPRVMEEFLRSHLPSALQKVDDGGGGEK
ncbi:MAG: MotA/TolQ/ExbB proton channel family protein [Myxococcales bacterium]|nr:MotA/TolQ/ExbB proton channel family protein [Myxococcales bacterium]MCB9735016.1 MotA/TolQ/ExbB proton channel family protein [Deltaproteobacteria bacterium]